jgi:feruloyl esterase
MGGREGFMEAQRYPADFDGVIVGHPAYQVLQGSIANLWLAQTGRRADESIILQAGPILNDLHQKVLDACDGIDGLVDGLIEDPRSCDFDPSTAGLTAEQLATVRQFVAGPHKDNGQRVYPGWVFWGGELNWQDAVTISTYYANEALRFLVFKNSPPLSYDYQDFNFNTDVPKLKWALDVYDAINADLTAFHDRGGKLILYHGLADPTVSPMTSINFYQGIADANGGQAAIQSWARLFLVPGMFHCGGGQQPVRLGTGGDSPVGADPVIQLVDWVENDIAPDKLIASYLTGGVVTRTRPVFPYPTVSRYSGSGSIDEAVNFLPAPPPVIHDDSVDWIYRKASMIAPAIRAGGWWRRRIVCTGTEAWLTPLLDMRFRLRHPPSVGGSLLLRVAD